MTATIEYADAGAGRAARARSANPIAPITTVMAHLLRVRFQGPVSVEVVLLGVRVDSLTGSGGRMEDLGRSGTLEPVALDAEPVRSRGSVETLQEREDLAVDLIGAFLLRPVTAPRQHHRLSQLGHEGFQIRDELIHAAEGEDEVPIAGHVERGDGHARSGEGGEELPVAIDV